MTSSSPPHSDATTFGRVLLVLPAFNEADAIGSLLRRVDAAMQNDHRRYSVLIVDDGSTDSTVAAALEFAKSMPVEVIRHEHNEGLGSTIRDGLRAAVNRSDANDIIVAMDADDTHAPRLIRHMTEQIAAGYDVVIASRYRAGSEQHGVPRFRQILSLGASLLFRLVFPTPGVKDYTCGYRAYRASLLKEAFGRFGDDLVETDGFQCMVDILLKLRSMNAQMTEVPMILRYDQKPGATKMRVPQTILATLALVVRRRLQ